MKQKSMARFFQMEPDSLRKLLLKHNYFLYRQSSIHTYRNYNHIDNAEIQFQFLPSTDLLISIVFYTSSSSKKWIPGWYHIKKNLQTSELIYTDQFTVNHERSHREIPQWLEEN